jgi:hypothetical protein
VEGGTASREKGQTWKLPGGPIKEVGWTDEATEVVVERKLGEKE